MLAAPQPCSSYAVATPHHGPSTGGFRTSIAFAEDLRGFGSMRLLFGLYSDINSRQLSCFICCVIVSTKTV